MLSYINGLLNRCPSRVLNWITFGQEHATLCGRLYLYANYGGGGRLSYLLMHVIDLFEPSHCYMSARLWRKRVCRSNLSYPIEYKPFFEPEYTS